MKSFMKAAFQSSLLLFVSAFLLGAMWPNDVARADGGSITGILHVIWGDPPPGSGQAPIQRFILTDDQGRSIPLVIDGKRLEQVGGIRAIERKRVTIQGQWVAEPSGAAAAAGGEAAAFEVESIQVVGPGARSVTAEGVFALSGSQPWATVLCRFSDSTGETPHPTAWFDTLMGSSNPGMDHYWQELSYGNIDLIGGTVAGWYNLPEPRSSYINWLGYIDWDKAAADCSLAADADVYFPGFVGINFMFNEDIGCCAWGGGGTLTIDGQTRYYSMTWMPPWGYEAHGVLAQEMGHGFGLPHSSGPYNTPYDSLWDPMSSGFGSCSVPDPDYGCIGVHTISYHKDLLGWIPASRRADVPPSPRPLGGPLAASQTLTIERLGQPTNSTDYLMAKVPINGSSTQFYTVEARRTAGGYDANIPGDAIVIHKVDTTLSDRNAQVVDATNNGDPNDAGAMWTVGETFTDAANGISVSVDSSTATGFVVTIFNTANDTYEEDDPAIIYTGAWSTYSCPQCSGGALKYSDGAGATINFTFTGTGIRWIVAKAKMLGKAKVSVDGTLLGRVDLYSRTTKFQVVLQKTWPTFAQRTVAIEVAGQKNPNSTGYYVDLDAFEVIP